MFKFTITTLLALVVFKTAYVITSLLLLLAA